MLPTNLDMDVLRTFVTGVDLGGFAKAAGRLNRSPSAISLQLRKLEEQTGQPLLRKQGRGLVLTDSGEVLLGYARRLLDLNDQALATLRGPAVAGWVRLGLPQDFSETWLPGVLAHFTQLHPNVRVEAHVDSNAALLNGLATDTLDLALLWDEADSSRQNTHPKRLPMVWIGKKTGFKLNPGETLPVVAFGPPCIFRQAGLAALDAAGIAWRISFSSPSLSGLWAAISAGLGVTVRTPHALTSALAMLDEDAAGLPPLPDIGVTLRINEPATPPVIRFATLIEDMLRDVLGVTRQA